MSLEFAVFKAGDRLPRQRELFENAFPEHQGMPTASLEHYQWKFHGLPWYPQSYEYEAAEDGRMLGYYAALPYPYEIAGRAMLAGMVCDVMTHSEARGRGVFTELGRFALGEMQVSELAFVMGYPIRPEVMGGHMRVGWQVGFKLPMYIRPLRANAILRSKRLGLLAPAANAVIVAQRAALARLPAAKGYASRSGSPSELLGSGSFAALVAGWAASVPNHLVKSAEFYQWRLGAPGVAYRVFMAHRGDEVVAAAIGREATLYGIPSFALLDLMVLPGHERALMTLYRDIECWALRGGAEALVTMVSRSRARQYRLARSGFLRSPYAFSLIARSVSDGIAVESLAREADWHLMWIDSDDL